MGPGEVLVVSLAQGEITSAESQIQFSAAESCPLLGLHLTLQPRMGGTARIAAVSTQLGPLTKSDLKSYSINGPHQK